MRKLPLYVGILTLLLLVAFTFGSSPAWASKKSDDQKILDSAGIERLKKESGAKTEIRVSPATGGVRFIDFRESAKAELKATAKSASFEERSMGFFRENAGVFGLRNVQEELRLRNDWTDRIGFRHLSFEQEYRGVPVFAGELKAHYDASGKLAVVNGNVIPKIELNARPSKTSDEAAQVALGKVVKEKGKDKEIAVQSTKLYVFRAGLAQGISGKNHLVWRVEVGNKADVREFVFIDAHSGGFVDQFTGVPDAMFRIAYDGQGSPSGFPPNWIADIRYWQEGDPFPTASAEANNMITSSKEVYDLYNLPFGRDSFDGAGLPMQAIFNRGNACPNASWNGEFISFCPGLTTDDVTGHEWTHAYTEFTHNLIYAWQPGALNESYSDIFGEVIDQINGRGGDTPNTTRTADACSSIWGTPPPILTITGGSAAGSYPSKASVNEPPRPFTVGPLPMAIVATASPFQPTGACGAVSGVSGMIAIVDWTLTPSGGNECGSGARATNAFNAGAVGIIFVAPAAGLLNLGSIAAIASVEVTNADGALIKAGLPASATMTLGVGTDNSVRWLMGEDATAVGLTGALRDMWNPRCFGNPGKVSDTFEYVCSAADAGGVHTNSGIPNHAFALIVDGGKYNGQTIKGIGLTKAANIYFRAMNVYQTSGSDFADHADAIERSTFDLLFRNLPSLTTGAPSGQRIGLLDFLQVHNALKAVEMRKTPACVFDQPLLGQDPPADPVCGPGLERSTRLKDGFEGDVSDWTIDKFVFFPGFGFTERDWSVVGRLPDRKKGKAFFAPDPNHGNCITTSEAAFLDLISPVITIPATAGPGTTLTFNHWVSTEPGFDFAQIYYTLDGGPLTLVPSSAFIYNGYNFTDVGWSGTDFGTVEGSWGRTIVNLDSLVGPGQSIQLDFSLFSDDCVGRLGWYVDDVNVYACEPDDDDD